MALNLITSAKVVETGKSSAKKEKTATKVAGLEVVAAIDHTIKWLTAIVESAKSDIYAKTIGPMFVAVGTAIEKKPDSFDGEEGLGAGTIQLKKRAANSAFTDDQLALVNQYKVPTDTSGGLLFVNPVHMAWFIKHSAKISAAITKLPDAPSDLFLSQPTKTIAADDSLDFIFKQFKKKPEVIAKLLPIVGTFSISPKFNGGSIENEDTNAKAFEVILKFLAAKNGKKDA
jgi:hypothetical protein